MTSNVEIGTRACRNCAEPGYGLLRHPICGQNWLQDGSRSRQDFGKRVSKASNTSNASNLWPELATGAEIHAVTAPSLVTAYLGCDVER
ncbi:MAG: hypothetical protein MUC43_17460 [Pirellula sp.]|nr:hypothetical protein [Pirellula sp.]